MAELEASIKAGEKKLAELNKGAAALQQQATSLQQQVDNAGGEKLRKQRALVAKLGKALEELEADATKKGVQAKNSQKQLDKLRKDIGKQGARRALPGCWALLGCPGQPPQLQSSSGSRPRAPAPAPPPCCRGGRGEDAGGHQAGQRGDHGSGAAGADRHGAGGVHQGGAGGRVAGAGRLALRAWGLGAGPGWLAAGTRSPAAGQASSRPGFHCIAPQLGTCCRRKLQCQGHLPLRRRLCRPSARRCWPRCAARRSASRPRWASSATLSWSWRRGWRSSRRCAARRRPRSRSRRRRWRRWWSSSRTTQVGRLGAGLGAGNAWEVQLVASFWPRKQQPPAACSAAAACLR